MATRDEVIVAIQAGFAEAGVEGATKKDAGTALDVVLAAIGATVMAEGEGGTGLRTNLGTFRRKETNDRMGHNPQTGTPVEIKGRLAVAFKPSSAFNVLKEAKAAPKATAKTAKAAPKAAPKKVAPKRK